MDEKRKESRLPLEVRVQILQDDELHTYICGDISSGGLFVKTDEKWVGQNDKEVEVRVFLPGVQAPLTLRGEVVRVQKGELDGVGVRFLDKSRELLRFCESRGSEVLAKAQKNVVLAHENDDMRYFLRTVLAVEGYRITEGRTVAETVAAVLRGPCDLIVANPLMKDDDGPTVAEWLQKHPQKVPVVMVSEGEVVGDAPFAGGDYALVTEPVELRSFRSLVWNLVK